jgi:bacterioferritin-associated ferredoxin
MIVCSCNFLSDGDVRDCLNPGPDCPRTPAQVYRCLGCSPNCGHCARTIRAIMDEACPHEHHHHGQQIETVLNN